ncbi:MAG: hypothetical protein B7Z42_14890 [Brevundimonas sp. 12-68-7]|uniref:Carboxypeptidase regulatory-like domain-containing protein n=1 Tax=Brevundimonas subvibrioides TaxID=74313 RepID=A0A258FRN7_9CAUL|nr:MAG: hypothetical protein B7Z42_14890 [Brevundimonas sp. 12-68-7]OYX35171.1 MAG: hypothetical protein B7Z01_03110 [Brevundimonas subvibrioides]
MSGPSSAWLVAAITIGVAAALIRLSLWWRAAPVAARGPTWRFPVLVALNIAAAGLLYLTLDPPDVGLRSGRLIVLTAGAAADPARETGDILVSLPEGPQARLAERVPDLATALRRHPEVRTVQVLGEGLTARDREAIDRRLDHVAPPAPPRGLTALTLPRPVAPGSPFIVAGSVGAVAAGTVELVDPADAVVARAPIASGGRFTLAGAARAAGLALFELRVKDTQGEVIERIDIPVETRDQPAPRVQVLAGAPGPETRFLRRWAEDAGIDLSVQLSLGAGVTLTAAPAPLTAQSLSEVDLLVIDERRWEALSAGERGAVRTAVAGGMGLLLRPTGPLSDATRRDWAALGASLSGGENTRPLVLDGAEADNPPAPPSAEAANADTTPPLELTRRDFQHGGADAVTLLTDADGVALASWRPYGAGRVGVWIVADSYGLVLTGQGDRYGELWSRMFGTLGRPEGEAGAVLRGIARAGERATLCGLLQGSEIIAPDGRRTTPVIDSRAGPGPCAAFWPTRSGWHTVSAGERGDSVVYVHPAEATPSLIAAERRQATLDLSASLGASDAGGGSREGPGSPWPWFLGLLVALGGLWWLERYRPAEIAVRDR